VLISSQPANYFADIEQAAFSPSTMVPGVAPSADPSEYSDLLPHAMLRHRPGKLKTFQVLQARMFAYPDAARYRLGVNYQQLPCNRPVVPVYSPYQRDGASSINGNYGADPNYVRSALKPISFAGSQHGASGFQVGGHDVWVMGSVAGYTSEVTDEDFVQARMFWDVLGKQEGQQQNLITNVAAHLSGAQEVVRNPTFGKCLNYFGLLSSDQVLLLSVICSH
jgi:catalase